ncbi:ABC transporter permease [Pelagibacteraceae bacterium]|nr:ABC transporter permease [Pelagibacteraceae bacterium]
MNFKIPNFVKTNQFGLLCLVIFFIFVFSFSTDGFTSRFNIYALSRVVALDIMIGLAMMVVILTGGLNLSLGALGVSAAMFGGWCMESMGIPISISIILVLAFGSFLGWINGFVTVRTGVHSFIVTLATMSIYFGFMTLLTEAEAFRKLPEIFTDFGSLKLFNKYISPLLIISVLTCLILYYVFKFTDIGRKLIAAGANPDAAELSGISVDRMFIYCHMLSGFLAALAGIMLTARIGAAIPSMAGHLGFDWLLPAFLAPVLGGTLLSGGKVTVFGTMLGAILVTLINNGLYLIDVGEFWIRFFLGMILLGAVLLDRAREYFTVKNSIVS